MSMRGPQLRITARSVMVVASIAVCAFLIWLAPSFYQAAWYWVVLRDVSRGQSTKYSAQGLATGGPGVVRALRQNLSSDQIKYRVDAARSLGVIGPDAKAAVPDLIGALRDPDREVKMAAIFALGEIGPAAGDAVEPLMRVATDYEKDPGTAMMAIDALGRIGPAAQRVVPVFTAMMRAPRHQAWAHVAMALCRMGSEGRAQASTAVPALIGILKTDKWAPNRRFAAEVLSEIGPAARQAVSELEAATNDGDPQVRDAARKALTVLERAAEASGADTLRKP
jgi:HEAT repeat protein